jgi:excisionase family DNA binding protein
MSAPLPTNHSIVVYTTDEAAKILRVKKSWLERQAARRKIPFSMLGGCYRFTDADLIDILRITKHSPRKQEQVPAPRHVPRQRSVDEQAVTALRPRPRQSGPRRAAA